MIGGVRSALSRVEQIRYRLRERFLRNRFERALGLDLYVPPTVLGVAGFGTGALLAREAARSLCGPRVLDMGCGTGIVAIHLARRGSSACAIDINPAAVRATRVNAMLNDAMVDAREGDLFAALEAHERFNLIAFNPPFFENPIDHPLALALSGGPGLPVLDRFLEGVRARLVPGGCILIAGSTNGALGLMRGMYEAHGFDWRTVRTRERMSERLVIDRLA